MSECDGNCAAAGQAREELQAVEQQAIETFNTYMEQFRKWGYEREELIRQRDEATGKVLVYQEKWEDEVVKASTGLRTHTLSARERAEIRTLVLRRAGIL